MKHGSRLAPWCHRVALDWFSRTRSITPSYFDRTMIIIKYGALSVTYSYLEPYTSSFLPRTLPKPSSASLTSDKRSVSYIRWCFESIDTLAVATNSIARESPRTGERAKPICFCSSIRFSTYFILVLWISLHHLFFVSKVVFFRDHDCNEQMHATICFLAKNKLFPWVLRKLANQQMYVVQTFYEPPTKNIIETYLLICHQVHGSSHTML